MSKREKLCTLARHKYKQVQDISCNSALLLLQKKKFSQVAHRLCSMFKQLVQLMMMMALLASIVVLECWSFCLSTAFFALSLAQIPKKDESFQCTICNFCCPLGNTLAESNCSQSFFYCCLQTIPDKHLVRKKRKFSFIGQSQKSVKEGGREMTKIASLPGFNCFIYAATVVWSSCARHLHTFFSFLFIILGRGPKRQRKPLCQCMRVSVFSFEPARIIITRIGNSWASLSVTANQRKKRGRRDTAASECTHKLSQFAVRPQWWRWRFWLCGLVGEHANFHHSFRPLACWFKSILIIVNDRERERKALLH